MKWVAHNRINRIYSIYRLWQHSKLKQVTV